MGRSTGALIEQCTLQHKHLRLYVVDTFQGSVGETCHQEAIAKHGNIKDVFKRNMERIGYEWLTLIECDSVEAASYFHDNKLAAVFIDGAHSFNAVSADIRAWLPKVRSGCTLAGHDYNWETVHNAVEATLGGIDEQIGLCWLKKIFSCHTISRQH
jgi:hypothetical protein